MDYPEEYKKAAVPKGMMATRIMITKAYKDSTKYQLMEKNVFPQTNTAQYIKQGLRYEYHYLVNDTYQFRLFSLPMGLF